MRDLIAEHSDFVPRIKADLNRTIFLLGGFFFFLFFLKAGLNIPLPKELFLLIIVLFALSSFLMFVFRKFRDREPAKLIQFHFGYNILQIVLTTIIIFYTGGITWITPFFYSFIIVNSFWIYPKRLAILILSWCNILLISLTILQYFRILPGIYIFRPEEKTFENFSYVFLTTVGALAILFFIGFFSNTFYTLLNNKIKELKIVGKRLEETKKSLETEIRNRTKEAEEIKTKLEKEVRERAKELEERRRIVQEKVKELEESHAITVTRELKMIKLKNKIAKLKKFKPKL